MKYRYKCPYCKRAFKHAGGLQRHKQAQTFRGACWAGTPMPKKSARPRRREATV